MHAFRLQLLSVASLAFLAAAVQAQVPPEIEVPYVAPPGAGTLYLVPDEPASPVQQTPEDRYGPPSNGMSPAFSPATPEILGIPHSNRRFAGPNATPVPAEHPAPTSPVPSAPVQGGSRFGPSIYSAPQVAPGASPGSIYAPPVTPSEPSRYGGAPGLTPQSPSVVPQESRFGPHSTPTSPPVTTPPPADFETSPYAVQDGAYGGVGTTIGPAATSPSDRNVVVEPRLEAPQQIAPQQPVPSPLELTVPQEEETVEGPSIPFESSVDETYWYGNIDQWFTPVGWEGSVEVGINGSAGNSESLSIQSGFDLKRSTEFIDWTSDLNYVKTTTDSFETQHNALFNVGAERKFVDSPWSLFAKSAVEYDEFKAWDLRWSVNSGLGYLFWDSDISKLNGRFGAGVSREFGGPDNSWAPEAVFGLDYKRQISKRQKIKFTSDFFPEFGDFSDYRLVTNFAWEFLLDEENNLSLKLDVTDRYDSTPSGRRPNDVNYSLLLLWKT